MEEIDFSHVSCVGDEEVRQLAANNSHVSRVTAAEAHGISDLAVLSLSEHCPDLDYLDVSRRGGGRITYVPI